MRFDIAGLILLSLVPAGVQPAAAQDDKVYAGISGMLSTQRSMSLGSDPDMPTTGVGGTAPGAAGEFGAFLTRTLSLAFELSVPARFDSVQETDYSIVFRTDNHHRDLVFSGLFHVHVTPFGPVRLAVVAGPSVIREDTLQRTAFQIGPPFPITGNFGSFGPETQLTRWTVGLTVGADVGMQVSRRVQIVPQIRLHWVDRVSVLGADNISASLGLGSWLIRPAVGARVSF